MANFCGTRVHPFRKEALQLLVELLNLYHSTTISLGVPSHSQHAVEKEHSSCLMAKNAGFPVLVQRQTVTWAASY